MELLLFVLFLVVLAVGLCYPLGWLGTLAWLATCSISLAMVQEANKGGGCDGGLCILPYFFIWLPICLVSYLVLVLAVPKRYRGWFGKPG